MKEYLVGMVCTECDQGEIEYNSIIKKYECIKTDFGKGAKHSAITTTMSLTRL